MDKDISFSTNPGFFSEEPESSAVGGNAPDISTIDQLPRVWINAAREGQVIDVNGELCSLSREAIESSLGTWKNGQIFDNHKTLRKGFQIYEDKFESPFLAFLLDENTTKSLKDSEGGSIDGIATKVEKKRILKMTGVGYSILENGLTPSCTKDAGCGTPIAGAQDVNIKNNESDTNSNTEKSESELKVKNKKQGGKKNMADEKEEVTYSKEQVAEIRAAAVLEVTEQLGNEHKVGITDLETVHAAKLKELSETHTTELETERAVIMKQAAMTEKLATMYGLSDEAKKLLSDAKSLEDVFTLFSTLKVENVEPVVAAEDGGQKGGGIVMGAAVEAKAPKVSKVEEVGNYNPYTRKYEATFREEMI